MIFLPLSYPEIFQQSSLTPPRGTLLARALAASCQSNGKGSWTVLQRKGADCLSKRVGEADRQLRLLFEEVRNQQPSIIFDKIDSLAPVVVIGTTNRPDAVDPALRRPGRFDREFYFTLPNLNARAKILSIITRKWEG
ncbi:P-loop containing nucleoside triphosphate hydrolase protein [Phellopilus nigrolimitatus]|nr:P-loop containing nucleoside triphosphate hydrolase protein [Phellopilus nigrolimitatus]